MNPGEIAYALKATLGSLHACLYTRKEDIGGGSGGSKGSFTGHLFLYVRVFLPGRYNVSRKPWSGGKA